MKANFKEKRIHYIDVSGKELFVSKTKNAKISFTLCHNEIVEGSARQEFQNITLNISKDSENIYNVISGIYNYTQDQVIVSEDPIRDGRNFVYLIKKDEKFYMMFNHDLANELRNPFETKIEVSNRFIIDLYEDAVEKSPVLTKRLQH